jgi:hypothetical protein
MYTTALLCSPLKSYNLAGFERGSSFSETVAFHLFLGLLQDGANVMVTFLGAVPNF